MPESVGKVRAALVAFATGRQVTQSTIDALALAASEAASNVVMHAYRQTTQAATIHVAAEHCGNELIVTVSDAGPGLTAHRDSPGLGLGLAIIIQTADAVSFDTSPSGGLRVQMRFAADRPDS